MNLTVKYDGCTVTKGGTTCTGVAAPPADSERLVKVYQSGPDDVGKVIAVHEHQGPDGMTLTADASGTPEAMIGFGCIVFVIGIVEIVRRRRSQLPGFTQ